MLRGNVSKIPLLGTERLGGSLLFFPIGHEKAIQRLPLVTIGIMVISVLSLFITTPIIMSQGRAITELWREKWEIEQKYIPDHGGLTVVSSRKNYEGFVDKIRAGEIIAKDSEDYETWERLDSKYEKKSSRTIFHLLGFIPAKYYRAHTFVTTIFVHGGVLHLVGNMWFLWLLGCNIEDVWGRRNFLLFFLGAGVVASCIHGLVNFGSGIPAIGASGAISGVMGAFMIRNYKTKIRYFYFVWLIVRPIWGTFLLPAWVALGLYFLMDLLSGFMTFGHATGTAYWAHVGGFLAGIAAAAALKATGIEEKYIKPKLEEEIEAVKISPLMELAFKEREKGNFEKASLLLQQLISQQPENVDAYRELVNIYAALGNHADAARAFAKIVQISLKKGEEKAALATYKEMKLAEMTSALEPPEIFALAGALYKKNRISEPLEMWQQLIKQFPNSPITPKAVLKCGTIFRDLGRDEMAMSAFQYLLSKYPDIEWKDMVVSEIESLKRRMPKKSK